MRILSRRFSLAALPVSLLLAAAAGQGAAAWGQLSPVGGEVALQTNAEANAAPSVTSDQSGNFIVAWARQGASTVGWDVWARRFNYDGTPRGAEFQVNETTSGCQQAPAVAADYSGNFAVVWQSDQNGGVPQIYARRYDTTGMATSGEVRVNTTVAGAQRLPAVVVHDGYVLVVWQADGQGSTSPGIYGQFFVSATMAPAGATGFALATGVRLAPAAAYLGLNEFAVTWQSLGENGNASGVYWRGVDTTGTPLGPEVQVNTTTTAVAGRPSIAADFSGNTVVAWESLGQDGSGKGVYLRRFHPSGGAISTEVRANTTTAGNQQHPAVGSDMLGNFLVSWESEGQDGSGLGIFGQAFDNQLAKIGGEFQVNTTTAGDQSAPSVASGQAGNMVAVWQGPLGPTASVYGQRLQVPGLSFYRLTPCRVLDTRNPNGPLGGPSLAINVPRGFTVAGVCGIPATAKALWVDVIAVPASDGGYMAVWAGDNARGAPAAINFVGGVARANNLVFPIARDGSGTILIEATTCCSNPPPNMNVVIDVYGYFQ
jgi:hypothetical protein